MSPATRPPASVRRRCRGRGLIVALALLVVSTACSGGGGATTTADDQLVDPGTDVEDAEPSTPASAGATGPAELAPTAEEPATIEPTAADVTGGSEGSSYGELRPGDAVPAPQEPGEGEVLAEGPLSYGAIVALGGVGTVGIGTPLEEAATTIGFDTSDPDFQAEAPFCAYMDPAPGRGHDGLAFMVFDGVVQRIDVYEGPWSTPSGQGIGSREVDLATAYGDRLVTSPHPYDEDGTYVEFVPSDPGNDGLSLLFETSGGTVTSFRVGYAEPVGFVEGCA